MQPPQEVLSEEMGQVFSGEKEVCCDVQRGEDKVGQDIYYPIHNFKNFVWIKTGMHIYK